jgi:hypothetical protein
LQLTLEEDFLGGGFKRGREFQDFREKAEGKQL